MWTISTAFCLYCSVYAEAPSAAYMFWNSSPSKCGISAAKCLLTKLGHQCHWHHPVKQPNVHVANRDTDIQSREMYRLVHGHQNISYSICSSSSDQASTEKTAAVTSGRSNEVCPSNNCETISGHLGLHISVRNTCGQPNSETITKAFFAKAVM